MSEAQGSEQLTGDSETATPQESHPARVAIGCVMMLVLITGCGWGVWTWVTDIPDYTTMAHWLSDQLEAESLFLHDMDVRVLIRNTPPDDRKDEVRRLVDNLFADGWHIRMTADLREYPNNMDQDWYRDAKTVSVVKRFMVKELIESATQPAGLSR